MHKLLFTLMFATFAFLTGCATTTSPMGGSVMPSPPPAAAIPGGPAVAMPMGPIPPARPEAMMGPPQNWGWLHTPPMGCDRGPNSLALQNNTDFYVRVVVDGEGLMVRGASGVFPELPPRTTVYVCLSHTGIHSIAGVAYTLRYGVPQEVVGDAGRFTVERSFGSSVGHRGRHLMRIDGPLFFLQ